MPSIDDAIQSLLSRRTKPGSDDLVHWASPEEYYRAFAAEEMCAVSRGLTANNIIQLISKGVTTLTGKESLWGTEFDIFGIYDKQPAEKLVEGKTLKSTAELVLAAEQFAKPYLISDAGHEMSRWLDKGEIGSSYTKKAKASDTKTTAGKEASNWLSKLSNQKPGRVPQEATDNANLYMKQAVDCYNGKNPPDEKVFAKLKDKVAYKINNKPYFGIVVKTYAENESVVACRRVRIHDDNTVAFLNDIDFVNIPNCHLTVLDNFPSIKELTSKALAGYLNDNNGLL